MKDATTAFRAALLGLAVTAWTSATIAAGLNPDDLVGSWTVEEASDDGLVQTIEIRIESVDKRGRATGTYCAVRTDNTFFGFHLRPKGGVRTRVKNDRMTFKRAQAKHTLSMNDDGTLRFDFKNKTSDVTRTLNRTETETCLAWFVPSGERVTTTVPEVDTGALVGTWAGTVKTARIELEIMHVDEHGRATGLFCWMRKRKAKEMLGFHIGDGAAAQASFDDDTLTAYLPLRRTYQWAWTGTEKLKVSYYDKGEKKRDANLKRAKPKGCLTQLRRLATAS